MGGWWYCYTPRLQHRAGCSRWLSLVGVGRIHEEGVTFAVDMHLDTVALGVLKGSIQEYRVFLGQGLSGGEGEGLGSPTLRLFVANVVRLFESNLYTPFALFFIVSVCQ